MDGFFLLDLERWILICRQYAWQQMNYANVDDDDGNEEDDDDDGGGNDNDDVIKTFALCTIK